MAAPTIKGTCPACFRLLALVPKSGLLARHGWREQGGRKVGQYGHAWHSGECFGVGWKPFEISPEGTVAYIKHLDKFKRGIEMRIEHLATHPMLVLHRTTSDWQRKDLSNLPYEIRLRPGDPERSAYREDSYGLTPYGKIPSYDSAWKSEERSWLHQLDAVTREIADCERRVETWAPGEIKAHAKQLPLVHLKKYWKDSWSNTERVGLACGMAYHIGYGGGTRRATDDRAETTCPKCLATLKKNMRRSRPRLRRSRR